MKARAAGTTTSAVTSPGQHESHDLESGVPGRHTAATMWAGLRLPTVW